MRSLVSLERVEIFKKVEKMKDSHSFDFFQHLDVNHTVTFEKSSKDLSFLISHSALGYLLSAS